MIEKFIFRSVCPALGYHAKSAKPAHLILHVTNQCNMRCNTCFVDFSKDIADIGLEEIKRVSDYLGNLLWLDIAGGEPFLRKDLPEICRSFNSEMLTIPTNGFDPELIYEATKKILDRVKGELTISVSIDGFKEVNDKIRMNGSFDNAIKTIKKLKSLSDSKANLKIKVNTVLCEMNYDSLSEFMKYVKTLGVDFHSIILLRGKPRNKDYRLPSFDKLVRIRDEIFKIWKRYDYGLNPIKSRILRNYHRIMYNTSLKILREKRQIPCCLAGREHLVVYSNGDVSFCEMLPSIGNIRENNLSSILNSAGANRVRKSIQNKECYCYHNCNMIDNYFLNFRMYPRLLLG